MSQCEEQNGIRTPEYVHAECSDKLSDFHVNAENNTEANDNSTSTVVQSGSQTAVASLKFSICSILELSEEPKTTTSVTGMYSQNCMYKEIFFYYSLYKNILLIFISTHVLIILID